MVSIGPQKTELIVHPNSRLFPHFLRELLLKILNRGLKVSGEPSRKSLLQYIN